MTESEWLTGDDGPAMLRHAMTLRSRCCGTLWYDNGDSSLSLVPGQTAKPCCDNTPTVYDRPFSSQRMLRLFAVALCRDVWTRLTEAYPRSCVEAAERAADGARVLTRLRKAANSYRTGNTMTLSRERIALACCLLEESHAAVSTSREHTMLDGDQAVWRRRQAAICRGIFGNPFRSWLRIPADYKEFFHHDKHDILYEKWLTPTVLSLAPEAYNVRGNPCPVSFVHMPHDGCDGTPSGSRSNDGRLDPFRLLLVAEALEDAGCTSEPLLRHLRGFEGCRHCMLPTPEEAEYGGGIYWCPGCDGNTEEGNPDAYWMRSPLPRYRGDWALDLILGKE